MAFRTLQSTGVSLNGYVNWTLSSFPIQDYNQTGMMTPEVPNGLTYCRYRDFRYSYSPYEQSAIHWNVIAARLAFIVVFEHLIFFIIYIMQWLVPDVPKDIQDKIKHERFLDQTERWTNRENEDKFKVAAAASEAIVKMQRLANEPTTSPTRSRKGASPKSQQPVQAHPKRGMIRVRISPEDGE